ncbi:MAG: hypothetical protein SFY66_27970 [Oculatellaceae cyanobacterium bins.114]|nr:hypothetical protein [Oculatellaceae cyanobacterium bins.114]
MTDLLHSEDVAAYNEESLKTLSRAIAFSQGRFSLILVRCNYSRVQEQIRQKLREQCPIPIRELSLHNTEKTLYTFIKTQLGQEQPQALMILGLDAVKDLDDVLTATNQVRDEFRKSFNFPLILWVNDAIMQKLSRLAPDFNSWAGVPIRFAIALEDLVQLLKQQADALFERATDVGAGRIPRSSALYLETDSFAQPELRIALADLQKRHQELDLDLAASLEFILGLDAYANNQLDKAYQHYQKSLGFWKANTSYDSTASRRRACVLFYLGLWWRRYAALHRAEFGLACRRSRDYYRQCVDGLLRDNHPDLAAKFIIALGEVLQRLGEWEELAAIAHTAVRLHQNLNDSVRLAYSYGLLAEVALARESWQEAEHYAELALQANERFPEPNEENQYRYSELNWARPHYRSLYLLLLAQAQHRLGLLSEAVENLEVAMSACRHAYDPLLYTRILEVLRSLYYKQGEYLKAFETKQEQRSIEQQYSLRAFLGAGRLKAERQVINPAIVSLEIPENHDSSLNQTSGASSQPIAIAQEISASGRQRDVEHLLERLSSRQYSLTIIHGQSGVGKSSIINAGLVPALEQKPIEARNPLAVVLNIYTDWIREMGNRLSRALAKRGIRWKMPKHEEPSIHHLIDCLRANADQQSLLTVLVFDQFEEFFFIYPDLLHRRSFFEFFGECLKLPFVKVVLSVREDYLHHLLECERLQLDDVTNNILSRDNRYPLGNFLANDAKLIVQRLTQRSQFSLEPALIDQLVQDLAQESGEVRPIELQLVGAQLQEDDIITLHQYRALGDNPKEKLVERFLERVVEDCGPPNQQLANLVLYLLTDEKGTRPLRTLDELTESLAKLAMNLTADADPLDETLKTLNELTKNLSQLTVNLPGRAEPLDLILKILVNSGLVQFLPEVPAPRYQLVHDYLVALIRKKQQPALLKQISELRRLEKQRQAEIEQLQRDKELLKARAREAELQAKLKRTRKEQRLAFAIAGMGTLLAMLTAGAASYAYLQARRAAIAEINATTSQSSALLSSDDQLGALVASIRAGRQLQDMIARPAELEIATLSLMQHTIYSVQEYNRLVGHESWVDYASFSPDGQIIASASADNTVRLWSIDGKLLHILRGHTNRVNSISFSPDGRTIASASDDGTVKLWNLEGDELQSLRGHTGPVTSVSFSPDGRIIASTSDDNTINLWRSDGTLMRTLIEHSDRVKTLSFSQDGTLVTGSWDGTVRVWGANGDLLQTIDHGSRVTSVSISPDGNVIASGAMDSTVKLWNRQGDLLQILTGQSDRITGLNFNADGTLLAIASADDTVKIWGHDTPTAAEFETVKTLRVDRVISINFGPDDSLASTDGNNTIRLWKLSGIQPVTLQEPNSLLASVSFSPDGRTIAAGGIVNNPEELEESNPSDQAENNGALILWGIDGRQKARFVAHGSVDSISFSPNGEQIAIAENPLPAISQTAEGTVTSTFAKPGQIRVWSLEGDELLNIDTPGKINSVSFSPDGKAIAAAITTPEIYTDGYRKDIGRLTFWNLEGDKIHTFQAHNDEITSISFSPDSTMIATGSVDNTVKLWNLEGENLATLKGHTNRINSVSFSPDGRTIASASTDTTIRLWSRDGEYLRTLEGHISAVTSIAFSRDGKLFVSASSDGTIKLWNAETGKLLATLKRNDSAITGLSFSNDGKIVASASADAVVLWDFNLDISLERGCHWLRDYLHNSSSSDVGNRTLCDGIMP